jgi:hypothetical protein
MSWICPSGSEKRDSCSLELEDMFAMKGLLNLVKCIVGRLWLNTEVVLEVLSTYQVKATRLELLKLILGWYK